MREARIGFAAGIQAPFSEELVLQQAETRDFIDFGFEPEFIGRLPVRVVCHHLSVDDLFEIITYLAHSRVTEQRASKQMRQLVKAYNDNPEIGRPPVLGEHTDAVLAELGYSRERIAELRERRAI